jgi:hypothetical protein
MAVWGVVKRSGVLRLVVSLLVLALVGLAVPVVWEAVDGEACWDPPADVVALAEDPEAATEALDPGEDLARADRIESLFAEDHWRTCDGPSGPELLGDVLLAAATGLTADEQDTPEVPPHTLSMARVVRQAVVTLGERPGIPFPQEFAPAMARVLGAYILDVGEGVETFTEDDEPRPAIMDERTGEARPVFLNDDFASSRVRGLMSWLAIDPVAYATLYDALRAYFAHYLDHLSEDEDGRLVAGVGSPPEHAFAPGSVAAITDGLAVLEYWRTHHIVNGAIEDGLAFDRAVLEHSRGGYLAAAEPPDSVAPEGGVPHRAPAAPASEWAESGAEAAGAGPESAGEWFLDPREQLRGALDQWVADRDVPSARAESVRGMVDGIYLRSVPNAGLTDGGRHGPLPYVP